jgi:hypothetical protein
VRFFPQACSLGLHALQRPPCELHNNCLPFRSVPRRFQGPGCVLVISPVLAAELEF